MAIILDDISLKFSKLIDLSIKNQNTLGTLLEYTIKNEKRLSSIEYQLLEEAGAGEFLRGNGTVTTNEFVIIDTMMVPGHMVKGYTIINDGPNIIYVGHNMSRDNVGPDIIDITSNTT